MGSKNIPVLDFRIKPDTMVLNGNKCTVYEKCGVFSHYGYSAHYVFGRFKILSKHLQKIGIYVDTAMYNKKKTTFFTLDGINENTSTQRTLNIQMNVSAYMYSRIKNASSVSIMLTELNEYDDSQSCELVLNKDELDKHLTKGISYGTQQPLVTLNYVLTEGIEDVHQNDIGRIYDLLVLCAKNYRELLVQLQFT